METQQELNEKGQCPICKKYFKIKGGGLLNHTKTCQHKLMSQENIRKYYGIVQYER